MIPGFGQPHLEEKLRILKTNLCKLAAFPGARVDVTLCVYDDSDVDPVVSALLAEFAPRLCIHVVREPGIVGQFLLRHAPPAKTSQYNYVMLLLDDVELQEDWDWGTVLRLKKQFHLNIVSPSLTPSSNYQYEYMRTIPSSPCSLKLAAAAEMFCYFMDSESYAAYYKYLDAANPWLWGIDLVLHKHAGFHIGLLNHVTMHHHYQSTCYGNFPDIQPYDCFLKYLDRFHETPQTLAELPAAYYLITEVAPPRHLAASPLSKACQERKGEAGYLAMLRNILDTGERKLGRNGYTLSVFGEHLEFDFRDGFPLLTTKRVFWKGIVEELLWFLKGHTDAKELQAKGVHIWDGNSTREFLDRNGLHDYPEGVCGPIYGFQWRAFNGQYPTRDGGVDQLKSVLEELTKDFASRRALLSGWNPSQIQAMCLPPCHVLYQFTRSDIGLCCHMYQRSADTFLGVPFNIASTALLTLILATALGTQPHRIRISFGDTHIYEEHVDVVKQQLMREPYPLPSVRITAPPPPPPPTTSDVSSVLHWIESLTLDDFTLQYYKCHSLLRAEMKA